MYFRCEATPPSGGRPGRDFCLGKSWKGEKAGGCSRGLPLVSCNVAGVGHLPADTIISIYPIKYPFQQLVERSIRFPNLRPMCPVCKLVAYMCNQERRKPFPISRSRVALNGRHIPSQLANSAQNLFRALNRGFLDSVDIAGKKALVDADGAGHL